MNSLYMYLCISIHDIYKHNREAGGQLLWGSLASTVASPWFRAATESDSASAGHISLFRVQGANSAGIFMRLGCEVFLGCDTLLDGPNILKVTL